MTPAQILHLLYAGLGSFAITFLTLGLWSLWETWAGLIDGLNNAIGDIHDQP